MGVGRQLAGFAGKILLVDVVVILLFGVVFFRRPQATGDEAPPRASGPWADVDVVALGREVGEAYLTARKLVLPQKRLELVGARVEGDDVVVRVTHRVPSKGYSPFPGTLYCPQCERQSCQFEKQSRVALEGLAQAFPTPALRPLAARAGARVRVEFAASAADAPLVPSEDERYCVGQNFKTFQREPGYDRYANRCGAHACEVAGTTLRVGSGEIDDPREVACLRAFCLHHQSTVAALAGELDARFHGRLGEDAAPAEIRLHVIGLAQKGSEVALAAFWDGYRQVVGDAESEAGDK